MKKTQLFFYFLCTLIYFSSCKKELKPTQSASLSNVDVSLSQLPKSAVPIKFSTSTGTYISSGYSGLTLDFGTSFPHDNTPDPNGLHDGEPVMSFSELSEVTFNGTVTIVPPYFDILIPKLITSLSADGRKKISDYKAAWAAYAAGKSNVIPDPQSGFGISSSWFIEVKGMVIRDHSSPALTSVCSDTYITPKQINRVFLGNIQKGNRIIDFYGPNYTSGQVTYVKVTDSGYPKGVNTFSLTYLANSDGINCFTKGTITLFDGTVITMNENITMP